MAPVKLCQVLREGRGIEDEGLRSGRSSAGWETFLTAVFLERRGWEKAENRDGHSGCVWWKGCEQSPLQMVQDVGAHRASGRSCSRQPSQPLQGSPHCPQVAPVLKERMVKKGSMMIGYQPHGTRANFFRMVVANPTLSRADIDFLLCELERLGQDL